MAILCLLLPLLLGCAADRDPATLFGPEETQALVVDAVLLVGQPLPPLYLRRSLPAGAAYHADALGVSGARVEIASPDGRYPYAADRDSAGKYLAPAGAALVRAEVTYALEIAMGEETLRATTTTPAQVRLREAVLRDGRTLAEVARLRLFGEAGEAAYDAAENQLQYLEGLLELRFAPVQAAGYQVALFSLDSDSPFLVDAEFLEEKDQADFARQGSSPAIADTRGMVSLPWFSVAYAGRHLFKVYAVDRNWFDLARTNPADSPGLGGGLAGDNFERPFFRVEGGIGLFGSASADSVGFTVLPRR
ncbi:MAG: DUF4249 family protein [Candidatus Handelsmanbacteria bacterium]|nr:DUF4249 family protein [Candidatus Handelsmanbacteria bacterium]